MSTFSAVKELDPATCSKQTREIFAKIKVPLRTRYSDINSIMK